MCGMNTKSKPAEPSWPKLTIRCPDDIGADLLRYWDWLLTPRDGEWIHPDDVKAHKRYRRAIKVLLEWVE